LGERTKQGEVHPVNRQAEADDGEAGKNSDEDGKNQEEYFFVEDAFESGKQATRSLQP
jgi:hypothetical protein